MLELLKFTDYVPVALVPLLIIIFWLFKRLKEKDGQVETAWKSIGNLTAAFNDVIVTVEKMSKTIEICCAYRGRQRHDPDQT